MSLLKRASVVLASIVFSLVASAASAAMTCDVNGDGVIDRNDINVIMAARGQAASGPGDLRDADGDGAITVTDARICTQRCTRASCGTQNLAPTANAGANQTASVGSTVTLDGSASTDPEGSRLTYAWSFTNRPSGSAAVLSDAHAVMPTFVVDKSGTYAIQLVVNDGQVNSAPASVQVSTSNSAPTANAGASQTVHVGRLVTLDGSGSSDPDGGLLTFSWSIVSAPTGSAATLSSKTAVKPTFTADKIGTYTISLVVSDGHVNSAPSTVTISTTNTLPVANAGANQSYFVGDTATLNGSGSSDADGDLLTYVWSLLSKPATSSATLSSTTIVNPGFSVDKAGTYVAQLIVNDGYANSAASTVTISTLNSAPVANAGASQSATVGKLVTLDGSGSTDVDGDALTYSWSFTSKPATSQAALSNTHAVKPTFTVDVAGTYVVQLVVNDGTVNSAPATTSVSTTNQPPVARAGSAQTVALGSTVQLDGTASSDPDGDAITYAWSITTKPTGSAATLSSATAAKPTFVADKAGTYVAQLIVSDGKVNSAPSSVTISTSNSQPIAKAGSNQTVVAGATVQLNGAGSYDPDGTALTYAWSLTTKPTGSIASLSNAGLVNPTFVADKPGTYVAQLIVSDGSLTSNPSTVTVTASNRAPVAVNDSYTVARGGALVIGGPGVLANDTDADGDALTAALVTNVAHGTLSLSANGDFTYTPTAGYLGADSFTYKASDGTATSNTATVSISVSGGSISVALNSSLIGVSGTTQGTITLSSAAPAGDVTVVLSSSAASIATISPATVSIAQGATTGTFTVTGVALGNATINATATGYTSGSASVTVTASVITVGNLSLAPGASRGFPVTLSQAAPAGGLTVTLTSSNTSVATVPAPVFIAAGAKTPASNPTATAVGIGVAKITGTATAYAPGQGTVTVAVTGTLTPNPVSVVQNDTAQVTLTLSQAAPAGGISVNLSVDSTATATAPPTVTVPQGNLSAQITVTGVAAGTTTLHASGNGLTATTATINVTTAPPITVGDVTNLGKDLERPFSFNLGKPAPAGNLGVTLTSSDPSKLLLSTSATGAGSASITTTVAAGNTSSSGNVYAQSLVGSGTATITATAKAYANGTGAVTFAPSGIYFYPNNNSNFSTTTLSPDTTLTVCTSALDPTTFAVQGYYGGDAVRAGTSVSVGITSSNTSVGTIVNSPRTLTGGQNCTNALPPDLAFHPVGAGNTTLTITTPAGLSTPSNYRAIVATVTASGFDVLPITNVGKDLERQTYAQLQAPAPAGGVNVTLTSSDASKLRLSADATTAGTASVTVNVPQGYQTAYFYVQALTGSGSAQVTASAPGYASGNVTVTFAPSGIYFYPGNNSNFSTTTLSPDTTLTVCTSALDPVTFAVQGYYSGDAVRAGTSVSVGITSSNTSVGTILNSPRTLTGGQNCTNALSPDLAFHPVGAGSATLTTTTPAGFSTPSNYRSIVATVTASGFDVLPITNLGKDLERQTYAQLQAPAPAGGVNVTLTSSDASKLRLSADATTVGTTSVTVNVPQGNQQAYFYVQALTGSGSAQVTASAPGYASGNGTITFAPSGAFFSPYYGGGSDFSTTTLAADTTLTVCISALDPTTLQVQNYYGSDPVRAGVSLSVGVASSNTTVGTIANTPRVLAGGEWCRSSVSPDLAFHPVGAGTSTLKVSGPSGSSTPSNGQSIVATVTATGIGVDDVSGLGKDLERAVSGFLQAATTAAGGVDVKLTSSDPSKLLLSKDAATAGAASIIVNVAQDSSGFTYYVQALAGSGTVEVTASATGYASGSGTVTLTPSGFYLAYPNFDFTTTLQSGDTDLRVCSSALDPVTLNVLSSSSYGGDSLRAGTTVTIASTSSNTSVGTIVNSPLTLTAGQNCSYQTSSSANFAFHPVSSGSSVITVSTPTGFSKPSNYQSVTATVN